MIKVNEFFFTIQGEATFTGMPSMFIRLQGCPVGCKFCDTKYTWTSPTKNQVSLEEVLGKNSVPSKSFCEVTAEELVKVWEENGKLPHIVISGGEPLAQPEGCIEIINAFDGAEPRPSIQFETSGTFLIPDEVFQNAWITMSPKINVNKKLPVLRENYGKVNEVKYPIETQADLDTALEFHKELCYIQPGRKIEGWLQPISQGKEATSLCVQACKAYGFRLSVQTHKYIGLD